MNEYHDFCASSGKVASSGWFHACSWSSTQGAAEAGLNAGFMPLKMAEACKRAAGAMTRKTEYDCGRARFKPGRFASAASCRSAASRRARRVAVKAAQSSWMGRAPLTTAKKSFWGCQDRVYPQIRRAESATLKPIDAASAWVRYVWTWGNSVGRNSVGRAAPRLGFGRSNWSLTARLVAHSFASSSTNGESMQQFIISAMSLVRFRMPCLDQNLSRRINHGTKKGASPFCKAARSSFGSQMRKTASQMNEAKTTSKHAAAAYPNAKDEKSALEASFKEAYLES
mmetsp:Transcript_32244/g.108600  ORF Transcript_32244/g.108600 Transcript_32244/m.108600 type:complete len:284 (+) Transcript_32244:239-1090(+)